MQDMEQNVTNKVLTLGILDHSRDSCTSRSIQCHRLHQKLGYFWFQGPNIAAIVAPTVILGVLAIVIAVVAWVLCVVKKKRQTEGTYRPSAEEQSGASCVAAAHNLKLPKEERLI